LFCFHLCASIHPSFLLFFINSSSGIYSYLVFSLLYVVFSSPPFTSISSSLLLISSFLFPISLFSLLILPYSLSFLLSFISILSHLFKQAPQSNVTMVTNKQLTGGGNVILLSATVRCRLTLCLSENNISVYFMKQEMIHCNGKQIW
jgi:hypothetical protein